MSEDHSVVVTLPDELLRFVEDQRAMHGHADAAAYIRSLVSRARQRSEAMQVLEQKLSEGIESGFSEMNSEDWDRLRQEVQERLQRRKRA